MTASQASLVCVGTVIGPHGVRGEVKVKSFTAEPTDLVAYGPLSDEHGRSLKATLKGQVKGAVLIRFDGVADRDQAEGLRGQRLYVPRAALPETAEDEFLYADLVGLRVDNETGDPVGTVKGVMDFGAGEVLDIALSDGTTRMVSFTKATVPVVDLVQRRLVLVLPSEIEAREP